MLVISQKKGEKLHIGRDITVTVVDIKANKVRLGIEAPAKFSILREPLYLAEQSEDKSPEQDTSDSAGASGKASGSKLEPSSKEHQD